MTSLSLFAGRIVRNISFNLLISFMHITCIFQTSVPSYVFQPMEWVKNMSSVHSQSILKQYLKHVCLFTSHSYFEVILINFSEQRMILEHIRTEICSKVHHFLSPEERIPRYPQYQNFHFTLSKVRVKRLWSQEVIR